MSVDALRLSLECSLWSTALSLVLGVPLAWVLTRSDLPGRALLRALVLLPMVLPPVVGGVALLFAFGRSNGILGPWLYHTFGIQLTFTPAGVVMAETFVAMPFLIITVEGGLRSIDTRFEDAAATLGAGPFTTFRRVTFAFLKPSLFAGTALAGRGRSASSGRRSPSPETSPAGPRRLRSRSTSSSNPIPPRRSR